MTLLGMARDAVAGLRQRRVHVLSILTSSKSNLAAGSASGIPRVKMKIGTHPGDDPARVRAARKAIGTDAELFVDANGAYTRKQALAMADRFAEEAGVTWFEEPVSSDDLEGLRLIRDRAPAGMEIAAGEYGYDSYYFRRMLDAGAVDVLQADATRCGGITGFLRAAALARPTGWSSRRTGARRCTFTLRVRSPNFRHLEYFHDHDGSSTCSLTGRTPHDGVLRPDLSRPGLGIEFKQRDADRYRGLKKRPPTHDALCQDPARASTAHLRATDARGACCMSTPVAVVEADLRRIDPRRGPVRSRQPGPLRDRRLQLSAGADRRRHPRRHRRRGRDGGRVPATRRARSSRGAAGPA